MVINEPHTGVNVARLRLRTCAHMHAVLEKFNDRMINKSKGEKDWSKYNCTYGNKNLSTVSLTDSKLIFL